MKGFLTTQNTLFCVLDCSECCRSLCITFLLMLIIPKFSKFLSSDFIQYSWIIIWRYISMLYHATLHRNPHIIFTNYLGSFAFFPVFNRTFLRVIDHFSGQEDQTFCRQWVPKKLHCWESSENQNHFLTQQTDACFHQTRVMVVPTVCISGQ